MTNKTKELVAAGHALAKELHCAESAALVRELATQLDVQLARSNALAAENAGLREYRPQPSGATMMEALDAFYEYHEDVPEQGMMAAFEILSCKRPATLATDAFLTEVWAQGRNEGINYAAGRLAAAFNHGFVDKPLTEVCDVVRMILDTKEELANSTLPAGDGLSGEYAEEFLVESAAQLRKGVQS
ncbi:hypothetical protein [Enterobacter hormaechei]|uniref:hypothetical protein n=1 Tax=Enterobacter hormaechei TaxID=158836 RepID=UPI001258EAE6|nr:hypothetical protein [Enterobacter hormaechei]VAG78065.1 Uncharacterised protein [Enterobacter hormaechei]